MYQFFLRLHYKYRPNTIIKHFKRYKYYFKDRINWILISIHQKLSEDFIMEYKNLVDWHYISIHQPMSCAFIEQFSNRVDWEKITIHQKLSEDFIREYRNRLHFRYILRHQRQRISSEFRKTFYYSW